MRNFMYVYERIYKEANAMQRQFEKMQVNGRRTSEADQKRIRRIILDYSYQIAQECSVIVSYPEVHIEGKKVVLGEPLIMLPDCRLISIEELRKIELGGVKVSEIYSIYMIGRNGVCPDCSGMAVLEGELERINCIDCGEAFSIKGAGHTDREIICTKSEE